MATVRELPGGRWQGRVYRNGRHETIGTFRTKKEAEIKAGEIERQIYYNQTITNRNMLFQEVIDDWYQYKTETVKDSTLTQLEVIKRLHIEPYFGELKLFQVVREDITEWIREYEEMKRKDGFPKYSFGARLKYLVTLKDIFSHAVHLMEVLNKNPSTKIKLPIRGQVSVRKEVKYYRLDDLDIFLDYLREYDPPRYKEYKVNYVLVFFLVRTGLRISEALALRWSDIDGNRLEVEKQTSRDDNNKLTISTLKTVSSYRNIELDEETTNLLMWFRKVQNKMVLKHKSFKRNEDMIIFQSFNGNYMTPSTVREFLRNHCLRAGVEYKGTHAFRHTHAVLGLEAGADLLYISRRLGHGSIQTTADTYLDITPQYESNELNKISAHLNRDMAKTWQNEEYIN